MRLGIRYSLIVLNLFLFFYGLYKSFLNQLDYCFFLIPLFYSILLLLLGNSFSLVGKTPGVTTIHIVLFFRYSVLPFVLCSQNKLSYFANNYNYMGWAIFYMLYEMIAIFVTLELTHKKAVAVGSIDRIDASQQIIRPSVLFGIGVFLLLTGLFFTNRNLISSFELITSGSIGNGESLEDVSSFVIIIWQCMVTWFYVYIVNRQKDRSKQGKDENSALVFSLLFTLIFITIIYLGQTRISRWYTLVNATAALFFLKSLYPNQSKKIIVSILAPVAVLLISASIFKSGLTGVNSGMTDVFFKLISATSGDSYFAGPVSINNAIGLAHDKSVGFHNIVFDIFNNMPVLNHFLPSGQSTVFQYNEYLGRIFTWNGVTSAGDQIIPLVGQSIIFFTGLFAPLLTIISILFVRKFDEKFLLSSNYIRFVWAFSGVWLGLASILNMTICLSWIYIRIIPLLLVFVITDWICKKIIVG